MFTCSKQFAHDTDPTATSLLLIDQGDGDWIAKPRCARHPAQPDADLMVSVLGEMVRVVAIPLPAAPAAPADPQAAYLLIADLAEWLRRQLDHTRDMDGHGDTADDPETAARLDGELRAYSHVLQYITLGRPAGR